MESQRNVSEYDVLQSYDESNIFSVQFDVVAAVTQPNSFRIVRTIADCVALIATPLVANGTTNNKNAQTANILVVKFVHETQS